MKIAYISTYLPKQCGIATFTNDLIQSIDHQDSTITQHVIALSDQPYSYPEEVVFQINTHQQLDYIQAAHFINENKYDCVVLEHEYGIFGGNSGVYILSLINQLHMPLLVNLHTILEKPNIDERAILIEIAKRASIIVVMSSYAIDLLQKIYHVHENKIRLIPHGVPAFDYKQDIAKEQLQLAHKKIILTFGFIARNKELKPLSKHFLKSSKNIQKPFILLSAKHIPMFIGIWRRIPRISH
ncbi:glycosyltransferase [Sphingobacterium sp. KU25419]|nr:glycosyltransferase [Sphingobacterium sp. KU25419]